MLFTLFGIVVFLHPAINLFDEVSIIALQLLRESYWVFPSSTTMDVKSSHSEKVVSPMNFTLLGIVMEVKHLQYRKLWYPILFTLLGNTKSFISSPFRKRCWTKYRGFEKTLEKLIHQAAMSEM